MIEREAKAAVNVRLQRMLTAAKGGDLLVGRQGGKLGGRAMIVGTANEQNLVAGLAAETVVDVGRSQ